MTAIACLIAVLATIAALLMWIAATSERRIDDMVRAWREAERDAATLAAGDEFRAYLNHPAQIASAFNRTRAEIRALPEIGTVA